MLIAAIVAAIAVAAGASAAGGGGDAYAQIYSQWKKGLKKHVKDKAVRAKADAVLQKFRSQTVALNQAVQTEVGALGEVNRNFDSTIEDYEALIDNLGTHIYTAQEGMLAGAAEIHEAIGADAYGKIRTDIRKDADKYEKNKAKAAAKREKKKAKAAKKAGSNG